VPDANRIFLWLLGALLLVGLSWYGYWFAVNFERHSREVRSAVSPEARKNPYLAAEHFLRRSGQAVQSQAGRDIFELAPSLDDIIFLAGRSDLFLQRNHDALLEWVSRGGHLILVPDENATDEEERYPLLAQLGVVLRYRDEEIPAAGCEGEEPCPEEPPGDGNGEEQERDERVTVTFRTDHPGDFQAAFLADRYLEDSEGLAEVSLGSDEYRNLLRYSLGEGTVTVLSDTALFSNEAIGEHDHAYLLYALTETPGKVWIFHSAQMPSLLALLWQRAPGLSLVTALLLLLAGWKMMQRSGPQLKLRYEPRRNLLEHLDASAEYSWRIDKARQLCSDNRNAIEQAWRRRHPQLNTLEQAPRCEWIGEKSGIAARAVERTLYGEVNSEQDFIRASAVLQRLAARLERR